MKLAQIAFLSTRLKKDKAASVGLILIVILVLLGVFAPQLSPHDPLAQDLSNRLQPPSHDFPFGTDEFGRDILSRLLYGARVSLLAGVVPVAMGLAIGLTLGLIGGFYGGVLDEALMRFMDFLLAFPYVLLALLIIAVLGPGLTNAMLAIGVGLIPSYARLARGSVLSIREQYFIKGAKAIGCSDARIMSRHILPNMLTPMIVYSTLKIPEAILVPASLSFIGLGAQPPTPEWGLMLAYSRAYMFFSPYAVLFPGLFIAVAVLGFNLLGDGMRDILDPRYRV